MQFRQKAMAKLHSPEELDVPLRFARPQGWLVLAVLGAVVLAGGVWAVTTISTCGVCAMVAAAAALLPSRRTSGPSVASKSSWWPWPS